ncbi:hypothetical protein AB0B63_07255 [Micromonospora sp. NPDC049081]|uniref:hypothetical protein n=1 Tax=Micromonospora sp. NPDC049081 TaxID=3155150 RepID=UPI0033F2D06E
MSGPTQHTALTVIAAGGVEADQYESIFVPNSVDIATIGELRLLIVVAIARGLAYRTAPDSTPGVFPVVLSTLGEAALRGSNPAGYQSDRAIEVRDGKVQSVEVKR